jgi:DNA-binding SARP family transcriptional activator/tetratricopeptide (TPR) repeat protein
VAVEFRLLGPVEVLVSGRVVDVGQPRQRTVLAALLVDAGRFVSWETLIDRVWGDASPAEPRDSLRAHIARLRKVLALAGGQGGGRVQILHGPGAYLIDVPPRQVDLHRFVALIETAHQSEPQERAAPLREALTLWRGDPLLGLSGEWVSRMRRTWRQRYTAAFAAWADAEIEVGNAATVIAPLTELADEHPMNESLVGSLMRALYLTNSAAAALQRYDAARQFLHDELGVNPGPQLQDIYHRILRNELEFPQRERSVAAPAAVPAQLPLDPPSFVGRQEQLSSLDRLLESGHDRPPVAIAAVSGPAGVGKTALAVHWAHLARRQFPDGQLYINLRGFDASGSPVQPVDAVRILLDGLAVPRERIPTGLAEQIGLYRSLLVDRRVLVVLDNARDAEQVRPLIPGSSTARVVVTSRNPLLGLVATEAARPVILGELSPAESRALLSSRLGDERIDHDPDAVDAIVGRCGGLPLALTLVTARAATNPGCRLSRLAEELWLAADPLEVIAGDSPSTDPRRVFSWSYQTLTVVAADLFRLLGLHPGSDLSLSAAASLAGLLVARARSAMAELHDAGLVTEPAPGRYAVHDLLHVYAAELVDRWDTPQTRRDAIHRTLDHYLLTAVNADCQLEPHRDPITVAPPQPGTTVDDFADGPSALSWFAQHQVVLVHAVNQAAGAGFDRHAWQLPWALVEFFDLQGRWHALAATQDIAVAAARRLRDPSAEGRALRHVANANLQMGELDRAAANLEHALALFVRLEDLAGQANTHMNLASVRECQGRNQDANEHSRWALELYRAANHTVGEGIALNSLGYGFALVGDFEQALEYCSEALRIHRRINHRKAEAHAADSMGYIHRGLGNHAQAVRYYRHALGLFREFGNRYNEADALINIGDTEDAAGESVAAAGAWRQAAAILTELHHPRIKEVLDRLTNRQPQSTSVRAGQVR